MENEFLSEKEIINSIKEYVDDDIYSSAILIEGEWASGKTFFVKNKLIKELEDYEKPKRRNSYKEKKIIYISLYGIKDIAEISNRIFLSVINIANNSRFSIFSSISNFIPSLLRNGAKVAPGPIKKGMNLISNFMQNNSNNTNFSKDLKNINKSITANRYILVLDDLEKCKCNMNDIFAYINNLVEHDDMKVILVANEDELQEDENQLKEYLKLKEKLIGTTIKYKLNLQNSIKRIISNLDINSNLKKQLIKNLPNIIKVAEDNNHCNLRTVQFFILKITRIYDLIKDKEYLNNEEVLRALMKYTFIICIYLKKGIYISHWKDNNLYGEVPLKPVTENQHINLIQASNTIKGFKFIDEFIVNSKLPDVKVIDRTINIFLEDLKESKDSDDPVNKLGKYYMMEDCEVESCILKVCKSIREEKYSPKRFERIARQLIIMEYIGFKVDEDVFDSMIKQIEKSKCKLDYNERILYVSGNEKISKRYQDYYKKMKLAAVKGRGIDVAKKIDDYFNNIDTWGSDLVLLYSKNNMHEINKGLLSNIDMDKVKFNIENSSTKQLEDFRKFIMFVYENNKSLIKKDGEELNCLLDIIKEAENNNDKKTKGIVLGWFEENLDDLIKTYSIA